MKSLKSSGFTVVETMIFLVVSSVIFVSVATMISGQLNKYQSKDSMNQLESTVRGVLNDVTNGYYPMIGKSFSCTDLDGTPGADNRGENMNCFIAGKSIAFEADKIRIKTYVKNPLVASPTIVSTDGINEVRGLVETKDYKWGIAPVTPGSTYYILNTVYSTDFSVADDNFVSGAQSVVLYIPNGTTLIKLADDNVNKYVCFSNGSLKSSLEFATGGKLGVSVNFDDSRCHP